ncbi:MAG: DNA polymerase I [Chloroflexota bacterium]|nr:DNA polymerase I [Chloroflexota bacterium]
MADRPKLVLIDGHALAYRAYHALPASLTTSRGELTNAVFGFTSMLLKVWQEEEPDYIAVTFDRGRTFRHEMFKDYKANRDKMPDPMAGQMARIEQVIEALGIPIYTAEGYEADDVLGALASQAEEQGAETLIVTGDTDTFQLVDEHTRVLVSRRRFSDTTIYDEEAIRRRYDLRPDKLVDYKAMVGDSTDNIPGVRGVGEKTALRLLKKYGSLEEIYEHLDEVPSTRFRNALEAGRDEGFLSQRLGRIRTKVPVELDWAACRARVFDRERVTRLFQELEFRSLMDRLPGQSGVSAEEKSKLGDYELVDSPQALDRLVEKLRSAPALAFDVETTSTNPRTAELVGLAVTPEPGRGYYVPLAHKSRSRVMTLPLGTGDEIGAERPVVNLDWPKVREKLQPIFTDESIAKYAHNGGYDLIVLRRHGLEVANLTFDTMIAEWLIDPGSRNLGLKKLAWARLGVKMRPITDLIGSGRSQTTMDHIPPTKVAGYAGADVDMTFRLVEELTPELKERELWPLFTQVEMPLVPILADMEMAGIWVDRNYLRELSEEFEGRLAKLGDQIWEAAGEQFNINSTQQLSDILFVKLGLPKNVSHRTKTGHYSTAADVLERLRDHHPIAELVLKYREVAKLRSTYVDALRELIDPSTGRVHTSYKQTGTVTGRLSSVNPNLQNIPIRTELGRRIRGAFHAQEGWRLLGADYSQVELRVVAHISQDPALLAAFHRGEDIHSSTAAAVYGVPLEEVTPEMRRVAKMTNFAIVYGVSGYGLAQRTGLSQEEATAFIEAYLTKYPKVEEYVEGTKKLAAEQGYVETLLGRRRYFPELKVKSQAQAHVRRAAERMAINTPVQGSAADIIKIAMINLDRELRSSGYRSRMLLQVHDELVLEVPEEELDAMVELVPRVMSSAYELDVPLKVDVKVGRNWLEMEQLD